MSRPLAWLDTVGSRVVALILGATLPLAVIAALLAWKAYVSVADQTQGASVALASQIRGAVERDIDQASDMLTVVSKMAPDTGTVSDQFALIQSIMSRHYCLLALRDEAGHLVVSVRGTSMDGCPSGITGTEPFLSKANHTLVGVIAVQDQLLTKAWLPCQYRDSAGRIAQGFMIAVRPIGWQNDPLPRYDGEHTMLAALAGHAWFVAPGIAPSPAITNQPMTGGIDHDIVRRLHSAEVAAGGQAIVYVRSGGTIWTMGPGLGPADVVVETTPSASDAHALRLFVWRVFLITTFLALELILVAIAAHAFLVDPMETLARAVMEWRRGGTFSPDLGPAVPVEIRHLERAMTRATVRLDRHEARLRRAAHNQTLLIREIHHRVKNNLQVVASLLNLQASRIRSPEAQEEFRLIRDRVRALATLHRYLYPDGGISQLEVPAFMNELCHQVFTANGFTDGGRIRLELNVEAVQVSPDQAVPIALIVTEVLSNALRHAYSDEDDGRVIVSFVMDGDHADLTISDNGVGIEATRGAGDRRPGIGLQLIRGFARQIRASLDVETEHGTRYHLRFVPEGTKRTIPVTD